MGKTTSKFLKLNRKELGEKQQVTEMPMKGMEIALSFSPREVQTSSRNFQSTNRPKTRACKVLCAFGCNATTAPEGKRENF